MPVTAFLALGANLGTPKQQIAAALLELAAESVRVIRRAPLYRSRPVGPPDQPDYVNTAAEVETNLSPLELLDAAKRVEARLGRTPSERWGPRMIDIDIALYGDIEVNHPRLRVPHAELARRRFVLAPLADLRPELVVPGCERSLAALLAELDDDPRDLERLDER